MIRNILIKYFYTPNSLRHDLEGELVYQHLAKHGSYDKLMDAGAGGGGYTQEIIGRGISKKVVAIEADEKNFRILESRAKACGGCVETHHSFLEDASVEPGSMDAVICNQVLEHIEDHHRAAQKLVDSLSPGAFSWRVFHARLSLCRRLNMSETAIPKENLAIYSNRKEWKFLDLIGSIPRKHKK